MAAWFSSSTPDSPKMNWRSASMLSLTNSLCMSGSIAARNVVKFKRQSHENTKAQKCMKSCSQIHNWMKIATTWMQCQSGTSEVLPNGKTCQQALNTKSMKSQWNMSWGLNPASWHDGTLRSEPSRKQHETEFLWHRLNDVSTPSTDAQSTHHCKWNKNNDEPNKLKSSGHPQNHTSNIWNFWLLQSIAPPSAATEAGFSAWFQRHLQPNSQHKVKSESVWTQMKQPLNKLYPDHSSQLHTL